ncbi:MAG: FkbM family methyltransferase [Anaerolineales bacterium]|nr:FkbM family methyltransferase [Anaerolineales bacterium]
MKKFVDFLASTWRFLTGLKPWPRALRAYLGRSSQVGQLLELRGSALRFNARSRADVCSIKETFLDRLYERLGAPIGNGWTIIDIGGGIGDFAVYVASQHPESVIYSFEPDPQACALLEENLRLNGLANARVFQQAVWSQSGFVLHPGNGRSAAQSVSLADAFERIGLAHCNLLRIGCRGAEYAILSSAPDEILARTERILVKYHDEREQASLGQLADFLTVKGFAVKFYPGWARQNMGYLYASR